MSSSQELINMEEKYASMKKYFEDKIKKMNQLLNEQEEINLRQRQKMREIMETNEFKSLNNGTSNKIHAMFDYTSLWTYVQARSLPITVYDEENQCENEISPGFVIKKLNVIPVLITLQNILNRQGIKLYYGFRNTMEFTMIGPYVHGQGMRYTFYTDHNIMIKIRNLIPCNGSKTIIDIVSTNKENNTIIRLWSNYDGIFFAHHAPSNSIYQLSQEYILDFPNVEYYIHPAIYLDYLSSYEKDGGLILLNKINEYGLMSLPIQNEDEFKIINDENRRLKSEIETLKTSEEESTQLLIKMDTKIYELNQKISHGNNNSITLEVKENQIISDYV